jgi:ribulose 1,5-bisphosphate synthetase/thiazole synthase
MRRSALLLALAVALSVSCGAADDGSSSNAPVLAVASSLATTTTVADPSPFEPIRLPFATRAWLNRAEGALVVESCEEVDAFVAGGRALAEVVEYRSYACGPTVTSMVASGEKGVADLFSPS